MTRNITSIIFIEETQIMLRVKGHKLITRIKKGIDIKEQYFGKPSHIRRRILSSVPVR